MSLALALALGLTACGGDGEATTQTNGPAGTTSASTSATTSTTADTVSGAPTTGGTSSAGTGETMGVADSTSTTSAEASTGVATDTTMGVATGTTGVDPGTSSGTGDETGEGPAPALPSAGCGLAGAPTGHFDELKINVGGVDRFYDLFVPAPFDIDRPHAVIFAYHGVGGTANTDLLKLDTFSKANDGFSINVAPQGWPSREWNENHFVPFNLDTSLMVFDQVLEQLAADYCIDLNRVFVTGHSNGGQMAFHLACLRGDRVRAVFPHGGRCFSYGPGVCDPYHGPANQCSGQAMVMSVMGEDDVTRHADEEATVAGFVARQGCGQSTESAVPSPCLRFTGCDAGDEVMSCRIPGLAHQIWKDGLDDIYAVMMSL